MNSNQTIALANITPKYIKDNYLTGLVLCGANGEELPDSFYETKLAVAAAKLSELTNVDVFETVRVGEAHDYYVNDYLRYGFFQLFHQPTRSVEAIRAMYGNQTNQVYPSNWVRLDMAHSQINLVPYSGSIAQVAGIADYLPFYTQGFVPGLWQIDYTSGFDPENIPLLVADAVCKLAVIDMLTVMSNLVGPIGVNSQSLSVDGLSQSRSYQLPAFKAMLGQYQGDLFGTPGSPTSGLIKQIKDNYFGIGLASL